METRRAIYACILMAFVLSLSLQAVSSAVDKGTTVASPVVPPATSPVAAPVASPQPQLAPKECGGKCQVRCKNVQAHQDRCLKYCNDCCIVCKCVPSGQYGNKDECPCYRDRKNSKGNSKCP